MDDDEVAPVLHHRVQSARLTPARASVRMHARPAQTVHGSVDYDLAVPLFPPESSPSPIPTTPWTPDTTRRRGRPPGARWCPPRALPWPVAVSGESPPWFTSPASSRRWLSR